MKNLKKLASLLLALVMVLSLATTAFADGETYSIEVTNNKQSISINGITYSAYKLFDVSYQGDAYSYTINEAFKDFEYTVGTNKYKGEALINYIATLSDNAEALNTFAEAALKYATDNKIAVAGTAVADDEKATIDVTSKGAGYYLIAGTATAAGDKIVTAACSLDTTNPTAKVTVKADAPSVDKVIVETDNTTTNGTSVNVGDTVNFKLTSKVPNMTGYETYKYIVHDTMSAGLTFNNDVAVKIGSTTLAATEYTVAVNGQSFTITIADLTQYTEGADIEITYSATLNEQALTTDVETNKVKLEYSNNPNDENSKTETPEDIVYVYDFDIVIDKYAKDDTEATTDNTRLEGAEFILYKKVGEAKKYYKYDETTKKVTWVDTEADATKVTTDKEGKADFTGLEAGTYYLHETKAPAGYNMLKNDIEVTITATFKEDGTLNTTNTTKTDNGQYKLTQGVENSTGTELPSTGGMGTTIFYVLGAVLMMGAAVLLITKRRMNAR